MSIYKQLSLFGVGTGKAFGTFSDEEKLKIQFKIQNRFREKQTGHITYYPFKDRTIRLEIEYMFGGKYHIRKVTGKRKEPLNVWGTIKDIVNIIEDVKFRS